MVVYLFLFGPVGYQLKHFQIFVVDDHCIAYLFYDGYTCFFTFIFYSLIEYHGCKCEVHLMVLVFGVIDPESLRLVDSFRDIIQTTFILDFNDTD
jgi:hypothetical protein